MAGWYWVCLAYDQVRNDKRPPLCTDCVTEPIASVLAHNFGRAKTHGPSCQRLVAREDGSKWYLAIVVGPWASELATQPFASAMKAADLDVHDEDAHCDAAMETLHSLGDTAKCFTHRAAKVPEDELCLLSPPLREIYTAMYERRPRHVLL